MNSPLEYNGHRAILINGKVEIFSETIAPPAILTLCSWCSQALTKELTEAGYQVSHGICKACSANQINELHKPRLYFNNLENNGCKN